MVPRAGSIIWNCSELQVGEWMAWWGVTKGTNRDHHGFWGLVCLRFWCLRSKWALLCLKTALWGWEEGAGGWFPACAARRHLRLSPALETRSCWAEHPWIAWTMWDGDPVFSLAQDHDTAFCLQLQTDFWQIEGFFYHLLCAGIHTQNALLGSLGALSPGAVLIKDFSNLRGRKKYLFVELVCSVFRQVMDPSPASPSPKVLPIRNKRGHRRTQSTLHVCMKMSNPWGETNTGIEKINSYWVEWDLLEYSSNSSSLTPAHKPLFASSFLCWKCYILLRTAHFTRREV